MGNLSKWRLSRKDYTPKESQFDIQGVMGQRGQNITFTKPDGTHFTDPVLVEEKNYPAQKPGAAQGVWISVKIISLVGFRDVTGITNFRATKGDLFSLSNLTYKVTAIDDTYPHQRIAIVEGV